MSPPGQKATPTSGGAANAGTLIKHAQKLLINCGITMSPSKVSRLVREYRHRVERNGFAFEAFLVNSVMLTAEERRRVLANPDVAKAISYPDPVGEEAVRHVMRHLPQQDHADLGLVPDTDLTEDLRPSKKNAPGRCANTAEGSQNNPLAQE